MQHQQIRVSGPMPQRWEGASPTVTGAILSNLKQTFQSAYLCISCYSCQSSVCKSAHLDTLLDLE